MLKVQENNLQNACSISAPGYGACNAHTRIDFLTSVNYSISIKTQPKNYINKLHTPMLLFLLCMHIVHIVRT